MDPEPVPRSICTTTILAHTWGRVVYIYFTQYFGLELHQRVKYIIFEETLYTQELRLISSLGYVRGKEKTSNSSTAQTSL